MKTNNEKLSLCPICHCMTKTIGNDYGRKICGKCLSFKDSLTNNEKWEDRFIDFWNEMGKYKLGIESYKQFIRDLLSQEKITLIKSLPVGKMPEKQGYDNDSKSWNERAFYYNQAKTELLEWQKEQIEIIEREK
jgi:hypothetical protein